MLLSMLAPVRLNTENQTLDFTLFAIPAVVGAVFTSPSDLILSAALAAACDSAIISRESLEKTTFNIVNTVIGVALVRLAFAAVLGTGKPDHLAGLEAVCLAVFAFEASTSLGVLGAVSLSSGPPGWSYVRTVGIQLALVIPLNAVFGVITITVALQETWGMVLLAAVSRSGHLVSDRQHGSQPLRQPPAPIRLHPEDGEFVRHGRDHRHGAGGDEISPGV